MLTEIPGFAVKTGKSGQKLVKNGKTYTYFGVVWCVTSAPEEHAVSILMSVLTPKADIL